MIRKIPLFLAASLLLSATIQAEPKEARYVRVDLSGDQRTLTLAEVEVISGGKNIAPTGKATQSSTGFDGAASRATDGNKDPVYAGGGQTHTSENSKDPWWELDLGKNTTIDQVGIWTRGEGFANRLEGFNLTLLNADKKPVYKSKGNLAPAESVQFNLKEDKIAYTGRGGFEVKPTPAGYRDPVHFEFKKGDRIAMVGNGLADRMQHDGWTETYLQVAAAGNELTFRNLSLSGDRVNKLPRSQGFTPQEQYLVHVKADIIFAFFGYNESFDTTPENYAAQLRDMVAKYRRLQPSGAIPRIVLFSPIAHENLGNPDLPNGQANNARLARIAAATELVAKTVGVTYVDLFNPSQELYNAHKEPLTINGIHLNSRGNQLVGEIISKALTGKQPDLSGTDETVREAVLDKNLRWHERYRATDGNDIWGGRSGLRFVDGQSNADVLKHELVMLDVMTANRDPKIWARAAGKDIEVKDDNVPAPVAVKSNIGPVENIKYLSGQEGIAKMRVPDGYEIKLFADEKFIPGMINPVQLQVDTKGRLWAACWATYPKPEPLKEMNDALLILHDDDKDGVADRSTEFARVANPLGFEFWNGGVIVVSQPDIIFLKDTDGDDKADIRYVLFQGIGSEDTHHAANNFIYGPDGGIYWQSGIFLVHNHENPWKPSLQTGNSGMYRFDPRTYTIAFHAGNSPNPHGIAFDYWGYHYATDGTGGNAFQVRPQGNGFQMHQLLNKEVRPVAASEIVSSAHFPDEVQQNFLICNTIGYLGIKQYVLHRDGFDNPKRGVGEVWGTPTDQLLVSDDKNFRPTDAIFGEDGALYVADWENAIIGHMQHNVRDPNRDKNHGRIYRLTYKGRPLQKPVKIDGQPIPALLDNLKHPIDGVRHRTRVELSERDSKQVIAAVTGWVKQFDPKNKDHAHHLLEALWLHQQHNVKNDALLAVLLESPVEHARIAATTVKHHWYVADPRIGSQVVEEEKPMEIIPGGVIADTADLTELRVNTIPEKMKYDVAVLKVKAGKKVKLTFANPDFMPHNLVITNPGKGTEIGNMAVAMGAEGFAKQFLPESKDILYHTNLLNKGETAVLQFTAPEKPGDYDYVCTFPGHSLLMRGILKVQ
ncbi:MAG: putative membrane-bound dehydrogenase-like protein [Verrucomicrobiales bacterium]|jgi:putative membrane-bound dehydrogenase-like protein